MSAIAEFITGLNRIANNPDLYSKESTDREFQLGVYVSDFIKEVSENEATYKDIAENFNKTLRRALGEGRALPKQLNIQPPKDYEFMSEDGKVSALEQARNRSDVTDPGGSSQEKPPFHACRVDAYRCRASRCRSKPFSED